MKFLAFLIALFGLPVFGAQASVFKVVADQSSVHFTSEAPMETVHGQTQEISGTVLVNPPSLAHARATFAVVAETIKTGNRLRDKNMRDDFLQTAQFPQIFFNLKDISGPLTPGRESTLKAIGTLTLHGVSKEKIVPVTALWDEKERTVRLKSNFPVLLSDFGIERPRVLWLRLSDTVTIDVDLFLKQ